jgi:hypothetical protein
VDEDVTGVSSVIRFGPSSKWFGDTQGVTEDWPGFAADEMGDDEEAAGENVGDVSPARPAPRGLDDGAIEGGSRKPRTGVITGGVAGMAGDGEDTPAPDGCWEERGLPATESVESGLEGPGSMGGCSGSNS